MVRVLIFSRQDGVSHQSVKDINMPNKRDSNKIQLGFWVDKELKQRLVEDAAKQNISLSEFVINILHNELKNSDKK